ncbi:MAG TPA: hypothetical protein VIB78_07900 [Acidimicrobiia bacterium]
MGPDRRRAANRSLAAGLAAFVLLACTSNSGTAMGVVIAVDGTLSEVNSFTLLVEGDELTFEPVPDGDYPYPLSHLREHMRDGSPIFVTWERVDGVLRALALEDA